jgi:hypothetical protein
MFTCMEAFHYKLLGVPFFDPEFQFFLVLRFFLVGDALSLAGVLNNSESKSGVIHPSFPFVTGLSVKTQ